MKEFINELNKNLEEFDENYENWKPMGEIHDNLVNGIHARIVKL